MPFGTVDGTGKDSVVLPLAGTIMSTSAPSTSPPGGGYGRASTGAQPKAVRSSYAIGPSFRSTSRLDGFVNVTRPESRGAYVVRSADTRRTLVGPTVSWQLSATAPHNTGSATQRMRERLHRLWDERAERIR